MFQMTVCFAVLM
uniref:BLTX796 n=1 Tax=Nephila pilipes TaxID=299642 RepID=A0A076L377_NEPPI|nr:BLTX796 [Nephila pilipes]